jgi:hypothetical protein
LVPANRRDGGTVPSVLAIPAVPVVKDHVHARRIFRQIIHSEELHYGRTFPTLAARIELANAHEHCRLFRRSGLPNGTTNHRWKAVDVSHRKSIPAKK